MRVTGDPTSSNNGRFYIHSDHLGSTSVLTKYSDGCIRTDSLTRYTPFGAYRSGGRNPITDRGFTGQRENMGLGLYYYNARYYLPGVGRFVSADTIVPDPQNPQSLNRYAYTLNSPLNLTDPSGHCPHETVCIVGGGGQSHQSTKNDTLDRLIQVNTWINQTVLWPITAISSGTVQQHNSFSHMLETVSKPAAMTANKVSAGLAIATGMFNQAEIIQRTQNGELTNNQAWKQTGVNATVTGATAYLGSGGIATGATTISGALQGTTILGVPAASAATPVVLAAVGVTSVAYVAPIAQGTANNMIEGQSFLPAFLDARTEFHNAVIGEELTVRLDEQIGFFAGPVVRGIGDAIIWAGTELQEIGGR
jgi:RHS repeat-associated protein